MSDQTFHPSQKRADVKFHKPAGTRIKILRSCRMVGCSRGERREKTFRMQTLLIASHPPHLIITTSIQGYAIAQKWRGCRYQDIQLLNLHRQDQFFINTSLHTNLDRKWRKTIKSYDRLRSICTTRPVLTMDNSILIPVLSGLSRRGIYP